MNKLLQLSAIRLIFVCFSLIFIFNNCQVDVPSESPAKPENGSV